MKKLLLLILLLPSLGWGQSQIDQFQVINLGWQPVAPALPPANTAYLYLNASMQLACVLPSGASCIVSGGSGTINTGTTGAIPYYTANGKTIGPDLCTSDGNGNLTCTSFTTSGTGTGIITFKIGTAPANPSSGFGSLYIDSGTQDLTCLNSSGGSCLPAVNHSFTALTTGVNSAATMTVSGAATISPTDIAQNAGNQVWLPAGLSAPTTSCSNTGGTINSGQSIQVAYTLNSALGQTLSSAWVTSGVTTGCSGGTVSITINAPTLPTGYTGWTAYYCNGSGSPSCTVPVQVASCVNITGNCVITSSTNGTVALPTVNTAWLQPPNVQATPPGITLPPAAIVSGFQTKVDGNSYPLFGQDASACSPLTSPCGIFTFWDHVFINDTGTNFAGNGNNFGANNGIIKNNAFGVAHLVGAGTTAASGFDDRAVGIRTETNSNMAGANNPRVMGIYGETILNGSPTALLGGGPDAGAIGIRWTIGDDRNTTGGTLSGSPMVALDGSYQFTPSSGTNWGVASCNPCAMGVRGVASLNANNINGGGLTLAGVYGQANGSSGGSNVAGYAFWAAPPSVTPQAGSAALVAPGGWTTSTGNWFVRSDTSGLASILGGTLSVPSIATDAGTLNITGSGSFTGAVTTAQLAAPTTTPSCHTSGATSFSFIVVSRDSNGGGVPGLTVNFTSCASDITATNYLQFTNIVSTGASSYDIFFTNAGGGTCNGGACTLGKVGTCTPTFGAANATPKCTYQYTGAAGDGTSAPTANTTGSVGPQFVSNTNGGTVNKIAGTCTASAATTCTVTFTNPYVSAPVCTATDATNVVAVKVTPSATSLVITTAASSSDVFDYICVGNPN